MLAEWPAIGRKVTDLKRIILTHAHPSHLGGAKMLKAASGAAVYSHDWEADSSPGRRKMVEAAERPQADEAVPAVQFQVAPRSGSAPSRFVSRSVHQGWRSHRAADRAAHPRPYAGKRRVPLAERRVLIVATSSAPGLSWRWGGRRSPSTIARIADVGRQAVRHRQRRRRRVGHGARSSRTGRRSCGSWYVERSRRPNWRTRELTGARPQSHNRTLSGC